MVSLVKTTYYEGKLDGQYEQYTEGGTLLVSGEYHNGGRSGAWYDYDVSSGTTTQAHYRLNERNGKYRRYTASHDLLEAGQCSNNVKVGLWREWDYNRGVSSYGNYDKQGQRHTTWIETDIKSEKVLGSICYDHGRQLAPNMSLVELLVRFSTMMMIVIIMSEPSHYSNKLLYYTVTVFAIKV